MVGEAAVLGGTAPPNWASNSAKSSKLENLKGVGRFGEPKMLLEGVKRLLWDPRGLPAGLGSGRTGNLISRNCGGLVVLVGAVRVVASVGVGVVEETIDPFVLCFCLASTLTLFLTPAFFFNFLPTFLLLIMAGL